MQELLGHRNVATTQKYIGVNYASARAAVEAIAVESQRDRSTELLSGSLKLEADETLFLELALRGYDLSKPLRPDAEKHTETAEIVKIG